MDENQELASSTPQKNAFGNTPKKTATRQRTGTPLHMIQENEVSETNNDRTTPVPKNPFEVKADSLCFSSFSPSVFATFSTSKTNGQFRWSIDHASILYPADIDESSVTDIWVDPDQEMKAQKAIDTFFSQNVIVPSPWSSESKCTDRREFRRTIRNSLLNPDLHDASTQTTVTIPPAVDLISLLGNEFVYNDDHEISCSSSPSSNNSCKETDVMSTSSLRRKLFVADEDCKTPPCLERKDLNLAKQWSTPSLNRRSMQSTPSDLLSSSPITPPNCSESCIIHASPPMSPIAAPSSHKSVHMKSFSERLDEESSSQSINKQSTQWIHAAENSMSFYMDSQDTTTFPSDGSEKHDTGYITSSQNVTSSDTTGAFPSRITPVAGFFDDCGVLASTSNISCFNNMSVEYDQEALSTCKECVDSVLCGSSQWALEPNSCSTPSVNL